MEKIEITDALSNRVKTMMELAEQVAMLKKAYPACWSILRYQFSLGDYHSIDFIKDSDDIIKIKLYSEIISRERKDKIKTENEVEKRLNKKS